MPPALEGAGGSSVRFSLFDDVVILGMVEWVGSAPNATTVKRGRLAGTVEGDFTLVVRGELMAGTVRAVGLGTFEISPRDGGSHLVNQIDLAERFSCGDYLPAFTEKRASFPPAKPSAPPGDSWQSRQSGAPAIGRGVPPVGCDSGLVIDLLVVYTEAAETAAGGQAAIEMRIASAATDTNAAFDNSLIDCSVNVVHTEEVAYTETGDSLIDGPRLLDPDDGFLDNVHTLRDQHSADVAILWVASLEVGGRVFAPMEPSGASGFHEMRQDNWSGLTMAHELGHNLGCAHDRPNAFADAYFTYSYGFHQPAGPWHDIMAVIPPNTPVIPFFSNPDVSFMGLPTGVAIGQPDESHCAATIEQTKLIVANYRLAEEPGLPSVLFVDGSATPGGDGESWAGAMTDLQHAICQAIRSRGDVQEIWVKAGTYYPDLGSGLQQMAYYLRDDLALYGGFDGTETMRDQRDPTANPTILSGDIGAAIDGSDDTNNVVMARGVGATAILDGFTITGGNADTLDLYFSDTGAGIRCDGAGPTIANCRVADNAARNAAGMAVYDGAAPAISGCTFTDNAAVTYGGAIHIDTASPVVSQCVFQDNSAADGGAVENDNGNGSFTACTFGPDNSASNVGGAVNNASGSPLYDGCTFTGNTCTFGGAMRNAGGGPMVTQCDFDDNTADTGGAVVNDGATTAFFDLCDFTNNASTAGGGAMATIGVLASPTISDCTFTGNTAGFGGGMYVSDGDGVLVVDSDFTANHGNDAGAAYIIDAGPAFEGCLFDGNTAGAVPNGLGGAIGATFGSDPIFSRCTFLANNSGGSGGAMWLESSPAAIVNCGFFGNFTDWSGGALENISSASVIAGCVFSGNRANSSHGGAMYLAGAANPRLSNLTISRNHAGFAGGGIAVDTVMPQISNCILWGNDSPSGSTQNQQIRHFSGASVINHSTIQGWTGSLGGVGNNGSNPLLVDSDGADNTVGTVDDDLRLSVLSPAIDSASNLLVESDAADLDGDSNTAERQPLDLDANPRFADDLATADTGVADPPNYPAIVDRGAYEFTVAPSACGSCDGDVSGNMLVSAGDIQDFLDCVLDGPTIEPGCECADMDASTTVDLADSGPFVVALLAGAVCP